MERRMGRREFLHKVFFTLGALAAAQWELPAHVQGADAKVVIKKPKLAFAETLAHRPVTNMIIIHHIGGTSREVSAAEVHQWHLQNGWAGIGYHFLVHKDGTIEAGRPIDTVGAHCYHNNQTSVGICSVGNFDEEYPGTKELDAAARLIAYVCQLYHIRPGNNTIVGHRDLNETDCPGLHYYEKLPELRKQVSSYLYK